MNVKRTLLPVLALLLAPALAQAQEQAPYRGFYAGLGFGVNSTTDSGLSGGASGSIDFNRGFGAIIRGGYAYGNGFRGELELGYRRNNADSLNATSVTGRARSTSLMANIYYDLNPGGVFTPYIGIGLGGARVSFDSIAPVGASSIDDSDTVFAYQGILGADYRIADQVKLFIDYRYFATQDPDFSNAAGSGVGAEYRTHALMVGVRWLYNKPKPEPKPRPALPPKPAPAPVKKAEAAPPPAPKPAPVPQPKPAPQSKPVPQMPRSYLVFFDWDRSNLTPEALRIVRAAAANARKGKVTRIEATGHADRSGPDAYNMRLSKRRALSVMAELVRQGIPKAQIAIFAKGERDPLVPTPDGVREPQNRRVEIVFK